MTGFRNAAGCLALLGLLFAYPAATLRAQDQAPAAPANAQSSQDSQTDANVLTALGTSKSLANVAITTNTVDGVVTLTGVVRDANQKQLAGTLTAHAQGVTRVVNNLTIAAAPAAGTPATPPDANNLPTTAEMDDNSAPPTVQNAPPAPPQSADNTSPSGQSSVAGAPPSDQNAPPQNNQGPPNRPAYQRGYNQYPQGGGQYPQGGQYAQNQYPPQNQPQRPPQMGGKQVMVPQGATLRIRTLETLDARTIKAGTTFSAVVLNNVMSGGAIAIPRGASLQGTVTEAKKAGDFGGRGKLVVTLNSIAIGGQNYTIVTDAWSNLGPNKTGRTVGNAIGLGAMGALIGAAAGGGPGAAIGAAAGAGGGVALSGATPTRQAFIPAEAVLIFHLQEQVGVTTVNQDELDRLAQNVPPLENQQPRMYRRGPYGGYPPPPPPGYNGYPY